jgi:hypothetical protein
MVSINFKSTAAVQRESIASARNCEQIAGCSILALFARVGHDAVVAMGFLILLLPTLLKNAITPTLCLSDLGHFG